MKKWTAGVVLIGLYRLGLFAGMLATSEFKDIAGEAAGAAMAPAFALCAWVGFGFAARLYFRLIRWD